MQIFAIYPCPVESARCLSDEQLRKMVTETAQLLSAAVREAGSEHTADALGLYKRPPSGQELVRWAAASVRNYRWLTKHGRAMAEEIVHRGLRVPASFETLCKCDLLWQRMPDGPMTPFVNRARNQSAGLDFTHVADVHDAYRQYLSERWRTGKWTWTRRPPPDWS